MSEHPDAVQKTGFCFVFISPPSGSYILSVPSSVMIPEPWRGDTDVSMRVMPSTITYFQPFDKLWVSALATTRAVRNFADDDWAQH